LFRFGLAVTVGGYLGIRGRQAIGHDEETVFEEYPDVSSVADENGRFSGFIAIWWKSSVDHSHETNSYQSDPYH